MEHFWSSVDLFNEGFLIHWQDQLEFTSVEDDRDIFMMCLMCPL